MLTTEASSTPGQDDDHELERQKKHTAPVRSRRNWLSSAAHTTARTAATTIGNILVAPPALAGTPHPPRQPYPGNHFDPVTPGPHSSCPLCGTPYRWGPSGSSSAMIGHEQTRDGPHRCPACFSPTRTQLSPTGAPTRFLSSGRREYITGYTPPSQSQQYLGGGVTTAYANTNNSSLPHGPPAARTGTSGQVLPADSRISERTPRVTRTQTRNYASGMCDGKVADLRRRINTVHRISPAS